MSKEEKIGLTVATIVIVFAVSLFTFAISYTRYNDTYAEVDDWNYQNLSHTIECYPQLKPIARKYMEDGCLSKWEYEHIDKLREELQFGSSKSDLLKGLNNDK